MLLACVLLTSVELPLGNSTQGFVQRITVESCVIRSFRPPLREVVVTQQLVDGTTGKPVGPPRETRYDVTYRGAPDPEDLAR